MLADATPGTMYLFLVGLCLFGIAVGGFMIAVYRRQSYEHWAWPLRWAYYVAFIYLVVSGGFLLGATYLQRIGLWPV